MITIIVIKHGWNNYIFFICIFVFPVNTNCEYYFHFVLINSINTFIINGKKQQKRRR